MIGTTQTGLDVLTAPIGQSQNQSNPPSFNGSFSGPTFNPQSKALSFAGGQLGVPTGLGDIAGIAGKALGFPTSLSELANLAGGSGFTSAAPGALGSVKGPPVGSLGIASPLSFLGGAAASAILGAAFGGPTGVGDEDLLNRIAVTDHRLHNTHPAVLNRQVADTGLNIGQALVARQNEHLRLLSGRAHLFDRFGPEGQQTIANFLDRAPHGRANLGEGIDALHSPITAGRFAVRAGLTNLPSPQQPIALTATQQRRAKLMARSGQ